MAAPASTSAKPKNRRIIEFDILRGWFLVMILIDHIELYPSGFDLFTGRGRLYVSAAEGFFFMSGLLVGLVYRRRIAYGMKFIFKKMWSRALELYVASVILTLLFTVAAVWFNHPSIKYGLPPEPVNWAHTIKETLLMRYGFGWADFLDRFALLMLLAPLGFYLLKIGKWPILLALSFIAWCFRGAFSPYDFTISWQFIFLSAMAIGYHWNELRARYDKLRPATRQKIVKSVFGVAVVTFTISYASVFLLPTLNSHRHSLPGWLHGFTHDFNSFNSWVWLYAQKWTQGPIRLALFGFWFSSLFMLVGKYEKFIQRTSLGTLELLGSNSLFVYIAHSFIVFGFKLFIPSRTNLGANFLITFAALVLLIAITKLYKKYHPTLAQKKIHLYQRLPWVPANVES